MHLLILVFIIFGTGLMLLFSFADFASTGIYICLLIAGVILVLFSSNLGIWQYELNNRIKNNIAELLGVDKENPYFWIGLLGGPRFQMWFIRILGLLVLGYSIYRLIH